MLVECSLLRNLGGERGKSIDENDLIGIGGIVVGLEEIGGSQGCLRC